MSLGPAPSQPVSIARGAVLTVAMRWTDRLIGIASTLILARLLTPADFGIVAMASLVVSLIDTLFDIGVSAALVQKQGTDREDFDAAWTLRLAQTALTAVIIGVAGAPLAADYFRDPRVEMVLWVMAITVFTGGLENIGIVALQKNMEFGREFRFLFFRRLAGFAATIALALWLHSYWAMVIGALLGRMSGVGLSYLMHEFRPRLSIQRLRAIWSFSQWMLVRNLGSYGALQVDKLVLGRRADAATLGTYNLADDVAALPVSELLAPIGRVLFPAFVRIADRPVELQRAFALALGVQTLVALPAGVGLVLVADLAVPLLLGPQWLAAVPVVQVLALVSVTTALTHSSAYLLLALGKVRVQALFVWGQFLLLAALLIAVFPRAGVQEIADVRLAVATVAMLAFLGLVLRAVPAMRARDILASCWRPVLGTAVMYVVLSELPLPETWPNVLRLAATIAAGGALYAAAILLLWRTAGRPDGAETYLLAKLRPSMRASATDNTSAAEPSRGNSETDGLVIFSARTTAELPTPARALLETAGQANPELGRMWFDNLQQTVYPDDAGIRYYAACRSGDECVAVLPVRRSRRGNVRVIESLSNFYTSLYAPALTDAATAADFAALLRRAISDLGNPHEIRLAPMDPDSRAFQLLESALAVACWVSYRYFCAGNWYLMVDCPWSEYLLVRPGEVQNTIKRNARRFAAAGGTIEIVCDAEGIDAATKAYGEVYAASWKRPEPYPDFIPGLIRDLAMSGSLRLGIARVGGEPVAAQIWEVRSLRAAIIKLAHDKDRPENSPGTLLTAKLMEHVIDVDRVVEVDYLIGDDPYKQNWMTRRRERWGIVAYNAKTLAGFLLLVREVTWRTLKAAKAWIVQKPGATASEPPSRKGRQDNMKLNLPGDPGDNIAT